MKAAILGGDKRMLYCAKALSDSGISVSVSCFDRLKSEGEIAVLPFDEALLSCDFAVLPIPCAKDGVLNAPFSKSPVNLITLKPFLDRIPVFCGIKEKLGGAIAEEIIDYSKSESFQIKNAELTGEGALSIAMSEYEGSIFGAKTLVCGYGRIAKCLSKMLLDLGADVTVAARKESDRAWARILGMKTCDFSFEEKCYYDLIFNTVPAPVLTSKALFNIAQKAIVIDLASLPGGVDFDYAAAFSIPAVHALSLPSKCAPLSAGRIIADTILKNLGGIGWKS